MQIIFKRSGRPELEPMFIAVVYRRGGVYRINVAREPTDTGSGNDEMPIGDYIAVSDFMDVCGIQKWVEEHAEALEREGKKVGFDRNFSYLFKLAYEQLCDESPIEINPEEC